MHNFSYVRAKTPQEASHALAEGNGNVKLLAGGTDLIPLAKEGIISPGGLVDISDWREGRGITEQEGALVIGALTPLSAIASDERVSRKYAALAEACSMAATPQLRNMGTIGGNLLQQTRCWYFRGPFDCWLKGGDKCYARTGENEYHSIFATDDSPCVSVHPSDPAAALVAFGARVAYTTPQGEYEVALADLYALPEASRRSFVALPADAVITAVSLPDVSPETRSVYVKAMARASWGFALAGVAIVLVGNPITDARVALSGVAPIPVRAGNVEAAIRGHALSKLDGNALADTLVEDAKPLSHNGYKVELLRGVFVEALEAVCKIS